MASLIPYGKQTISSEDIKAVNKSLKKEFLTTGPGVKLFEKKFSNYLGCKFSVSSNSGTSAIFLALKSIDLKKNDTVIIPSINFIAAANLSKILNARIIFSDVDPLTGQMTPENLLECIRKNKIKKIKVIFTMHNGGFNNHAKEFFKIKKKYKCFLIEDACHALGGKNSKKSNDLIGNCKYSDLTTFSFHPLKTITTGEGGMTTTNNIKFYNLMRQYRNHGWGIENKKNSNLMHNLKVCGFNFRLTDLQCYLGLSQLKKIDNFVKKRNSIAKYYLKKMSHLKNNIFLPQNNKYYSAWHLFIILFKNEKLKISRDKIMQILRKKKIATQVHYIPSYRQKPFYVKNKKKYPGAEFYFSRCLSLPIFPNLKFKEVDFIVKTIENLIKKNKKISKK
tara:strand:- start:332 stop:1507 length:1176 start_codon:yes stop_codon:yes gene_type:complete